MDQIPPARPLIPSTTLLECVINVSEGRDHAVIARIRQAGGNVFRDLHTDHCHNRSVLTLVGSPHETVEGAQAVARETIATLRISEHSGVHPRIGTLDVVPFVALIRDLDTGLVRQGNLVDAVSARDTFSQWACHEMKLPCFKYGPTAFSPADSPAESAVPAKSVSSAVAPAPGPPDPVTRTLPEIRRHAWRGLLPDCGPTTPHPEAGACAVGARPLLVAYNLWTDVPIEVASKVAKAVRGPNVRALGLEVDSQAQVSCNLLEPMSVGPGQIYDSVAYALGQLPGGGHVIRTELVGLIPRSVLDITPRERWKQLDLAETATIESRLE